MRAYPLGVALGNVPHNGPRCSIPWFWRDSNCGAVADFGIENTGSARHRRHLIPGGNYQRRSSGRSAACDP
jgi:hypothetical protein